MYIHIYKDVQSSNSRLDIVMQPIPLHTLGDDLLPLVMYAIPASKDQNAVLRECRAVCKTLKKVVDTSEHYMQLEWRKQFEKEASDFRDDVLLHGPVTPPISFNRRIGWLLYMEDWNTLFHAMREYNVNEPTQEYVIARLMEVMTSNNQLHLLPNAPCSLKRRDASAAGVQGTVAWAMRTHPRNIQMLRDGARVLSFTTHEPHQIARQTVYILRTLTSTMYNHLEDLEIQHSCIKAVERILSHIEDTYNDVHDDAAGSIYVIDKAALFQTGVYNIATLVINAMRQHMGDHDLIATASSFFFALIQNINNLTNSACMQDFIMRDAEVVLLETIHRNSHGVTRDASGVQEICIFAMQELMTFDFASMQHIHQLMQCTINAALQNKGEFVDGMVQMFHHIMTEIGTDAAKKTAMQKFVATSGMVHILLQKLLAGRPADDDDTFAAFAMVTSMCEGNAETTALMVAADVARTIDSVCTTHQKSPDWHAGRDSLLAIFDKVV